MEPCADRTSIRHSLTPEATIGDGKIEKCTCPERRAFLFLFPTEEDIVGGGVRVGVEVGQGRRRRAKEAAVEIAKVRMSQRMSAALGAGNCMLILAHAEAACVATSASSNACVHHHSRQKAKTENAAGVRNGYETPYHIRAAQHQIYHKKDKDDEENQSMKDEVLS